MVSILDSNYSYIYTYQASKQFKDQKTEEIKKSKSHESAPENEQFKVLLEKKIKKIG